MDKGATAFSDPMRLVLMSGLLLLPIQFVQIGPAQLSQLWVLAALVFVLSRNLLRPGVVEALVYGLFLAVALVLTFASGYERTKAVDQVVKFAVLYPAFYLVGRALGNHYLKRSLPFGYVFLAGLLAFEFAVQFFELPVIHRYVAFMQGALYGTFKERNWLAIFFFLCSYLLFLQSSRDIRAAALFVALCIVVALLSESKTILIPVGFVLLLHFRGGGVFKLIAIGAGAVLFYFRFGPELSGDLLRVRLEEERGLAFMQSIDLIARDFLGYGFGFVEAHFSGWWISIRGLGAGTNSVFSSPLDLFLIAGAVGLCMWLVFFLGVGLGWRVVGLLLPVALWSLVNPLHQSEIVYLFMGVLVSFGLGERSQVVIAPVRRGAVSIQGVS